MNQRIQKEGEPILSGNWKNITFWNFYISPKLPPNAILTTATALIIWEGKIVLVENNRGWDLAGGHIEDNETSEEALVRELYEETGLKHISSITMFGYREIINPDIEKINKVTGKPYPKYAYDSHFIVEAKEKPTGCQDGTCYRIGFFDIDSQEVKNSKVNDIINLGYNFYINKKT